MRCSRCAKQRCTPASTSGLYEMSVNLCSVRDSGRQHGQDEGAMVGGLKPLHRFLKGQPKIAGIIVLILGVSSVTVIVANLANYRIDEQFITILPCLVLSAMFIASGILYILTENNPTKKTVTISMALSIISVLCMLWFILSSVSSLQSYHDYSDFDFPDNATIPPSFFDKIGLVLETVHVFNSSVGGIICLVMSILAGAALRSTKSQAIVLMTTMATEEPKH